MILSEMKVIGHFLASLDMELHSNRASQKIP